MDVPLPHRAPSLEQDDQTFETPGEEDPAWTIGGFGVACEVAEGRVHSPIL